MPQPIRPPSSEGVQSSGISWGPDIVLQRPDLALKIASIITNWVLVEDSLQFYYGLLMGEYLPLERFDSGTTTLPPTHPVAFQIFKEVESFRARTGLVDALAKWRLQEEDYNVLATLVMPQLNKAHRARNLIAHGHWGISANRPDCILLIQTFGHPVAYNSEDLHLISNQILEAHGALNSIINAQYQRRVSLINHEATPY